ncbi:TSUP family transporter [Thorsellia kenyensis]|uniref:Probable membrane transporter protein n=1 Tax=Thorsellia kenyensis TaxID=1549888 RepID=A0ABV6CF44_9GAMM
MSFADYGIFFGCVGLACFAQNLTGFAFGLIFLGLISLFGTLDLATAANVISILSLANALPSLKSDKAPLPKKPFYTSLALSLIGVVIGLYLLNFLNQELEVYLKILLGLTILIASFLLILSKKTPEKMSSLPLFAFFGGLSGILGGLFSTAGPPLVYIVYRQPIALTVIKRFLVLSFAANAIVRIALEIYNGHINWQIITLSAMAFPFVLVMSMIQKRYPIKWPIDVIKKIVFVLLVLTSISLLTPAARYLLNF